MFKYIQITYEQIKQININKNIMFIIRTIFGERRIYPHHGLQINDKDYILSWNSSTKKEVLEFLGSNFEEISRKYKMKLVMKLQLKGMSYSPKHHFNSRKFLILQQYRLYFSGVVKSNYSVR